MTADSTKPISYGPQVLLDKVTHHAQNEPRVVPGRLFEFMNSLVPHPNGLGEQPHIVSIDQPCIGERTKRLTQTQWPLWPRTPHGVRVALKQPAEAMFQQDAENGYGGTVHPGADKALRLVKPVFPEDVLNRPLKTCSRGLECLEPVHDVANLAEIKGNVADILCQEDGWLAESMGNPNFVQDIVVPA